MFRVLLVNFLEITGECDSSYLVTFACCKSLFNPALVKLRLFKERKENWGLQKTVVYCQQQ